MTLCDRWHKLPHEVLDMPAASWQVIKIAELGGYFDQGDEGGE
jgi:hypothetical protein